MRKLITFVSIILMISLANSAEIDCNFSGEACNFYSGTPITQPNEVITIVGKPSTYVNTATTLLYLSERFIVRYIPAYAFTIFPKISWMSLIGCGQTNLVANFSASCPDLVRAVMDDGFVKFIPEGFLQTCSNLNLVSLRNQQIVAVDKNAFRGLAKLENIELTSNKITCLHPDIFLHTPKVLRAGFSYNKINALDRNLLWHLKQIAFFDVKYNFISYLPAFNLTVPANSMAFYGYGNPITAINPNFCSIFTNRINYIYIKDIPCLPKDTLMFRIDAQNCQTSASILQSCYANWSPAISDTVVCEQGSGACIPPNVWSKFTEFVNYLPV